LAPDYYLYHLRLALALWSLADWKGTSLEYREAIRLLPSGDTETEAALRHALGLALEKLRDTRAALDEYQLAHSLAPDNLDYAAAYRRLSHR